MEGIVNRNVKAFLVEDSPDIRTRLAALLQKIDGIELVGEADTPPTAVEGILRTRPHFVLLDIQLIGGSGIDVLRRVRPVEPGIVFIVLTNHPDPQYRKACMRAGATHFLDKANEFDKVKEVVENLCPAQ